MKDNVKTESPTEPWSQKGAGPNPWSPDYLRLAKKRPGFRCKFIHKDNVENRLLQGWTVCRPKDYGNLTDHSVQDIVPQQDRIQRRELILMEIPEEMALERERYMETRNTVALDDAKQRARNRAKELNRQIKDERGLNHELILDDDLLEQRTDK